MKPYEKNYENYQMK